MMPAVPGFSGWESIATAAINTLPAAYSAVETARAQKAAAVSAAQAANAQTALETQRLALQARMANATGGGSSGIGGVSLPVLFGGAAALGLVIFLVARR